MMILTTQLWRWPRLSANMSFVGLHACKARSCPPMIAARRLRAIGSTPSSTRWPSPLSVSRQLPLALFTVAAFLRRVVTAPMAKTTKQFKLFADGARRPRSKYTRELIRATTQLAYVACRLRSSTRVSPPTCRRSTTLRCTPSSTASSALLRTGVTLQILVTSTLIQTTRTTSRRNRAAQPLNRRHSNNKPWPVLARRRQRRQPRKRRAPAVQSASPSKPKRNKQRKLDDMTPIAVRQRNPKQANKYSALIPLLQRQVLCVDTTASTPSTLR